MCPYPNTLGESRKRIREFTKELAVEELRGVVLELLDRLPPPFEYKRFHVALDLLRNDFGGPFPDASREVIFQALNLASLTGGDLADAVHAYIAERAKRTLQNEPILSQERLQELLREIMEGDEG